MKKRLIEEIRRMSELAGVELNENLLKEATNRIDGNDGIVILVSDFVKNHIMTHNKVGAGSIFKSGVNEAEIVKMVTQVASKVSGDGGAYELNQSGIGYDLVLPMEAAKKLPDAVEGTVEKQEGPSKVTVPSISTSEPIQKFVTNRISLIIRKSNPQFLPEDVKADESILGKIKEGKCYSLLTAFPGNPDIPKASEWGGKFAVILPGQKPQVNEGIFNMFNKKKTAPAPAAAPAAQPAQKPAAQPAQAATKMPAIPGKKGDYAELQIALQNATPQQIAVWMGELSNTVNKLKKKYEQDSKNLAVGQQMMSQVLETKKKQQKQ